MTRVDEWAPFSTNHTPVLFEDEFPLNRRISMATADPGAIVPRLRRFRDDWGDGGDEHEYEALHAWQARAVMQVIVDWLRRPPQRTSTGNEIADSIGAES